MNRILLVVVYGLLAGATSVLAQSNPPRGFGDAQETLREFVTTGNGAPSAVLLRCPGEDEWHDEVREGLLQLTPTPRNLSWLAPFWAGAPTCQTGIRAWLRAVAADVHDVHTGRAIARGLLRTSDPVDAAALRSAALNPAVPEQAREAMLQALHRSLSEAGRVELFVEMVESGTVAPRFASTAAAALFSGPEGNLLADRGLDAVMANPDSPLAPQILSEILFKTTKLSDGEEGSLEPEQKADLLSRLTSWAEADTQLPNNIRQLLLEHGVGSRR